MKTTRLYLTSWEYNAYRLMSRLAVVVENANGKVIYPNNTFTITNRSINEVIDKKQHLIENAKDKTNPYYLKRLNEYNDLIEKCGHEAKTPIETTHSTYISFTLDGYFYNYNLDTNPFFDFYFTKAPIIDGNKYDANRYGIMDKKEWFFDCFLYAGCSDADIAEAAELIFNMLIKSNCGQLITEKHRVPNTYDSGYHYENFHNVRMREVGKLW